MSGVALRVNVTIGSASGAHLALVFAGFILFNLAMNAGPNATTFTLAPELFPTGIRASASGFAAAAAKVGATLGIFVLPQVKEYAGGHMFYARPDSQSELRADAMKLFGIR